MTKTEFIEKYGVEKYEAHIAKNREHNKTRYHNDIEFRKTHNAKCSAHNKERYNIDKEYNIKQRLIRGRKYCKAGEFELIENYELAKADNFKGWDIHHKLEICGNYINTVKDLKMMNLYYDRPAEELIWLKHDEHIKLHRTKL